MHGMMGSTIMWVLTFMSYRFTAKFYILHSKYFTSQSNQTYFPHFVPWKVKSVKFPGL